MLKCSIEHRVLYCSISISEKSPPNNFYYALLSFAGAHISVLIHIEDSKLDTFIFQIAFILCKNKENNSISRMFLRYLGSYLCLLSCYVDLLTFLSDFSLSGSEILLGYTLCPTSVLCVTN